MPYGIPKSKGGDTPENIKKMESCISNIKGDFSKEQKIAICKKKLFGNEKENAERKLIVRRNNFIWNKMQNNNLTFFQSNELFNKYLFNNNYIF